jgi:hypothetical protein
MGRSGLEARHRPAGCGLWLRAAQGPRLLAIGRAPLAGGRCGTAARARRPRTPLRPRGRRAALRGGGGCAGGNSLGTWPPFRPAVGAGCRRAAFLVAGRSACGRSLGTRSPFRPAVGDRWCRATVATARGPAQGRPIRTRSPFGPALAGSLRTTCGRLRPPTVWALGSAPRATIARAAPIAPAGTVEEIAAVAVAAFGKKDGRHRRNRLGRAEQLDAPRGRHLLFRRQNPENCDPIDLNFGLDTQDIPDLRAVRENFRVDDTLGLTCSGSPPSEAPVTTDAGQFDVETVRHAGVKLQAAEEFAKWDSKRARERSRATAPAPTRYNLNCGT